MQDKVDIFFADRPHASSELPATRDIGCNTEPPQRHHVGTQLSLKTLHSHYRSEGW